MSKGAGSIIREELNECIYLGLSEKPKHPCYTNINKNRFFMISGGINSAMNDFAKHIIDNRLENDTGFIFFDAKNDINYLTSIKVKLSKLKRSSDLIIAKDFNFDLLDALCNKKIVYIHLDNELSTSLEYTSFLRELMGFMRKNINKLPPYSIFTNGCEEYLNNQWLRMHESGYSSYQQINIFHILYSPEKATKSLLGNTHHLIFFKLDNPSLLVKTDLLDYLDDFYIQLKSLKGNECLDVDLDGVHKRTFEVSK